MPSATDDTLRLVGQRHPVQALHLKQCAALTGSNLAQHGSYSALRRLSLETCDLINGWGARVSSWRAACCLMPGCCCGAAWHRLQHEASWAPAPVAPAPRWPTLRPPAPPPPPPRSANLSDSVHEMRELEELRITGCAQVTALRLHSLRLQRVELCGVRALQDLDMRCARLQQVTIQPLSPGLAACHALK